MRTRIYTLAIALLTTLSSAFAEVVLLSFNADGHNILTYEAQSGQSYRLDTILSNRGISVTGCRGYNFVGWKQGGPVVGDENPTSSMVTTVTPTKNLNLYAVYQKPGAADHRYVRITSTKDLHPNSQYLVVCYYDHDGDIYYGPSYFALGNQEVNGRDNTVYNTGDKYSSYDVYATKYSLSAEQIYPDAGVWDNSNEALVWTLGGSEDEWTLTNEALNPDQSLAICDGYATAYIKYNGNWRTGYATNYNHHILSAAGNTFAITAANGVFNFRAANGYYLTYSDDDEDYFKTGVSNSWTFYLYKKEPAYTSYPDCSDWMVHLDACDGTVGSTGLHKDNMTDVNGAGVILPTAQRPAGLDCAGWNFAGWSPESPIQGTTSDKFSGALLAAGTTYHPTFDGATLYAVYSQTEVITQYERITSSSAITQRTGGVDDEYIILTYNEDKAISTAWSSGSIWALNAITANDGIITEANATSAGNVIWKFDGTRFKGKNTNQPLAWSQHGTKYYFYTKNNTSPFYFEEKDATSYHLYWLGNQTDEDEEDYTQYINYRFYIYKKNTKSITTYISYPHCTPYSVTFHSCGGIIGTSGTTQERTDTETSAGLGLDLPVATPRCPEEGWTFSGWLEGGELSEVEETTFTGLHKGRYVPTRNNSHLYAVYQRDTTKFRMVFYPQNMAVGDNYLITWYDGVYDWEITPNAYNATTLEGVMGESPQDGSSWYIIARDSLVMWRLGGTANAWTFYNDSVGKYLHVNTSTGDVTMDDASTGFTINRPYTNAAQSTINAGTRYLYYDGTKFTTSTDNGKNDCFLYRQMKVFTSWPHCEPFTVYFDAGNGTAGASSLTEDYAYADVVLPNAYVNSDCSKEGWTFAGWAKAPITNESDALTEDLYPAGSLYSLTSNNSTLYAVYYVREDTYKKISSTDELKMGVNYIITNGANNKALSNTPYNSNYIMATTISPSGNVITSTDETLDWRLQGRAGEYELYNHANEVFLDLSSLSGYARLTPADDGVYDNFLITMVGEKVVVRSNKNLLTSNEDVKYLGYSGTYFYLVNLATAQSNGLYFYQQEAVYHTYPSCIEDVDAIHWTITPEGGFVTVESYVLDGDPLMQGATGYATFNSEEGTFTFKYNPSDPELAPCSPQSVTWADKTTVLKIPYIVDQNMTSSTLFGGDDCSSCDVVVMTGDTLTISENRRVHTLTVQDGAGLNVSNGVTLTVNSLVLDANGDQSAPSVTLNNSGSIILKNEEMYYDLRIPEDRFYWVALPFNTQLQEISYSNVAANGGIPTYNTNFFVYYYDGAHRADDANAGVQNYPYWTKVAATGNDYTMKYGQGYLFGIDNQAHINYNGQTHSGQPYTHKKRVYRFTMRPPVATWLPQERDGGYKVSSVVASSVSNPRNDVHAGWNLIGNPYMHSYATGTVSGLRNGAWKKEIVDGVWTRFWILDEGRPAEVPYVTLFDPETSTYSQELASSNTLRPFQAVFVQINSGSGLKFESNMNVSAMPAYKRFLQAEDKPVRTGITLTGNDQSDRTGIVLAEEYTKAYEIGADLQKMFNNGRLNLYTLDTARNELAFHALSDEDAVDAIPVGVMLPSFGTYTFAFDAKQYNISAVDTLQLIDIQEQTSTDLLHSNYVFTADGGMLNDRFLLLVRRAKEEPQIATDIDNNETHCAGQPRKIIRDGQLFIIYDDKMYNAVGTQVK